MSTSKHLLPAFPYIQQNGDVDRLHAILSNTSSLDKILILIQYGSKLMNATVFKPQTLSTSTAVLTHDTSLFLQKFIISVKESAIHVKLDNLSAKMGDIRVFLRLWGLLGMYKHGVRLSQDPPRDPIVRMISKVQWVIDTIYCPLEATAYLSSHKILGAKPLTQAKLHLLCCRIFVVHIIFEAVKMFRIRQLSNGVVDKAWWDGLISNVAYLPMALHWSNVGGIGLSESMVAVLGTIVGCIEVNKLWHKTTL
ncbi:hypothetical protein NEOLI_003578 [Neolecta irregularis DAH-3]|uniref:Peroxisomal membrane protein 11C n=1 Tax=Neolecta irregularis (strain DAH-3) TaxID=1198029 RepID=A0A1U7LU89_NEOID|nr:hypothetical protein NEOLI_003578 [Neolecta irregularis DAH-3]|eukprot:OLL26189.1 hypothetical protein NEOLI_003578 [Neolecta irregularis DAH-3]